MNKKWIEDQFQGKIKHWYHAGTEKIRITKTEVIRAMKKMGKNKAQSKDGLTDNIFQERTWGIINPDEVSWEEHNDREGKKDHTEDIRQRLAIRLALYLNYVIDNKDKLPFE